MFRTVPHLQPVVRDIRRRYKSTSESTSTVIHSSPDDGLIQICRQPEPTNDRLSHLLGRYNYLVAHFFNILVKYKPDMSEKPKMSPNEDFFENTVTRHTFNQSRCL